MNYDYLRKYVLWDDWQILFPEEGASVQLRNSLVGRFYYVVWIVSKNNKGNNAKCEMYTVPLVIPNDLTEDQRNLKKREGEEQAWKIHHEQLLKLNAIAIAPILKIPEGLGHLKFYYQDIVDKKNI